MNARTSFGFQILIEQQEVLHKPMHIRPKVCTTQRLVRLQEARYSPVKTHQRTWYIGTLTRSRCRTPKEWFIDTLSLPFPPS